MILLKGIDDGLVSFLVTDEIADEIHVNIPIATLFATSIELDQHLLSISIVLNDNRLTPAQRRQMERLYLISTSDH
jgi:hypothetical protein